MNTPDNLPAWAQEIVNNIKEARQEAVRAKAKEVLTAAGVSQNFWKRAQLPESPSDVDTWAKEIITDFTEFQKTFQQPSSTQQEIQDWADGKTIQSTPTDSKIAAEIEQWAKDNL